MDEAALPGAIWIWKADWSDRHKGVALVLTRGHLLVRKLTCTKQLESFAAELDAGRPAAAVLGRSTRVVELRSIRRLRVIDEDDELTIDYGPLGKTKRLVIGAEANAPYRELFEALRQRLAPGIHPYPTAMGTWEAARLPLLGIGIVVLIAGAGLGVHFAAESGSWEPGGIKGNVLSWIVGLLGPWGLVGVFGAVAALLAAWLVARVRNPPKVEEIVLR
jgi:hypothetical protein